jgi:hemolysin activation/secretion protein
MRTSLTAASLLLALCQGHALAQHAVPNAGSLLANTPELGARTDAASPEGFPIEYYPRMRWTDDFSVQVDSIVIEGNTLVPTARLQAAVKGHAGKRLMVDKLSVVTSAVNRAYREAGFRAKAYIPDQSFGGGRLVVQVIEVGTLR